MARKVGGIVAELLLNDKDFRNKLNRAGKLTESRAAQMRKTFNRVGKAALTAAAAAGGTLAAGIALANTRMDQLAKTSDKLGIAPDKLQELRYAANQAGIAMGVLDTATQRMVRRVAEAAQGRGTALGALTELNLDAKEMARLAPEKQMRRIAGAMGELESQGDRVRLAMALFDTEGVALVNMLRNGEEGMEAMAEEFRKFGVAVTRLDLAKIEAANDNFTRLKTIQEGFWNQLAIQSAPVLEMVGNYLLDNIDRLGGMGAAAEKTINFLLKGAGYVADALYGWQLIHKGLEVGWIAVERTAIAVSETIISSVETAINKAIGAINWLIRQANRIKGVNIGELGSFELPNTKAFFSEMARESKDTFEKSTGDLKALVEKGRPSAAIQIQFERLHEDFERRAKDLESKVGQNVDEAMDPLADLGESAKAAAREIDKLSLNDIVQYGGDSSMANLARRALQLEDRAKTAEFHGRGRQAERYQERADDLRRRIEERRTQTPEDRDHSQIARNRRRRQEESALKATVETEPKEVRSGGQIDKGRADESDNASVLREILAAIKALPESVGVI